MSSPTDPDKKHGQCYFQALRPDCVPTTMIAGVHNTCDDTTLKAGLERDVMFDCAWEASEYSELTGGADLHQSAQGTAPRKGRKSILAIRCRRAGEA